MNVGALYEGEGAPTTVPVGVPPIFTTSGRLKWAGRGRECCWLAGAGTPVIGTGDTGGTLGGGGVLEEGTTVPLALTFPPPLATLSLASLAIILAIKAAASLAFTKSGERTLPTLCIVRPS